MKNKIEQILTEAKKAHDELAKTLPAELEKTASHIIKVLNNGGKVIIFGNGGSAADSQHFAAELVGRFKKDRCPLPAIALNTNVSTLTSVANDYTYAKVFSRQIEALGKKGDAAIGISTSGNSENVIEALKSARELGLSTISFTGKKAARIDEFSDFTLKMPAESTPRIQELHILCIHILCELIEAALCS